MAWDAVRAHEDMLSRSASANAMMGQCTRTGGIAISLLPSGPGVVDEFWFMFAGKSGAGGVLYVSSVVYTVHPVQTLCGVYSET